MRIRTTDKSILISGTEYEHRGLYAEIPSCRYNKNAPGWEAPASPVTAMFIRQLARLNHIPIEQVDNGFNDLLLEMREIISRSKYKENMTNVYAKDVSYDNWLTTTVPWAHQKTAALFCEGMRAAYLAMEMGTGKTLVVINEILEQIAASHTKFLILCPKSVIDVWGSEFEKHASGMTIPVVLLKGGTNKQKASQIGQANFNYWQRNKPAVIVVNYESVWRDKVGDMVLSTKWRMVVCDEAHKIKSPSGKASRFCSQLGRRADIRRGLSGTPLPNNQLDAYGQWRFLDTGYFGTNFASFRARYCQMGGYQNHEIVDWKRQDEFRKLLDYLTFRVDKSVLDLPPETHTIRNCELPDNARRIYRQIEKDFIAELSDGSEISITNVLKRLTKLQQISSGFIINDEQETLQLHHEKTKLLSEFLESIDKDEKVVVFCRFVRDLAEVRRVSEIHNRSYGELSGRANDLRGGMFDDSVNVLGAQLQAGGIGVNLTAARYCVMYSVGYSLADYLQAMARVYRGGQERPVTYIHLISEDTIDEQVHQALAAKKEVVDEILAYIKREKR